MLNNKKEEESYSVWGGSHVPFPKQKNIYIADALPSIQEAGIAGPEQ